MALWESICLNLMVFASSCFQIQANRQLLGVRTSACLAGGRRSTRVSVTSPCDVMLSLAKPGSHIYLDLYAFKSGRKTL